MPIFRDDHIVIISPGSETTLVNIGLGDTLSPPALQIPTKVYKHSSNKQPNYFSSKGEEVDSIYPIKAGVIVNLPAFNYFLKLICNLAVQKFGPYTPIALLVLSSPRWNRLQVEDITQYAFETLKVSGLSIVPTALTASYAYASSDTLVIDVGFDKTEITPINDLAIIEHAQKTIDFGGSHINSTLKKYLSDLSEKQIDCLKRSPIYEVVAEDEEGNSLFAPPADSGNAEEEGIIDVAAIVSSGRTREILDEREKEKQLGDKKKNEPLNVNREFNTFVDDDGKTIEVGKERFYGTESLIEKICDGVGEAMKRVDQVNKRQDCWDNIVICGRGAAVKGFKEALTMALQNRYIILRSSTYSEIPSTFNTGGQNTPNGIATPVYPQNTHTQGHGQSPASLRLSKAADYFLEWKGQAWDYATFLGAEIAAKQIFTGSIDNIFVSRTSYNEVGPSAIWEI